VAVHASARQAMEDRDRLKGKQFFQFVGGHYATGYRGNGITG
jgi:hypothetical protein